MLSAHLADAAVAAAKAWSHEAVEPRHVGYAIAQHFRERPEVAELLPRAKEALEPYGSSVSVPELTEDARAILSGIGSPEDAIEVLKGLLDGTIAPGETLSYSIGFTNTGAINLGDADAGVPVVIRERIPKGTVYIGLSSSASNTPPAGAGDFTIMFSTNNGVTWQEGEPADPTTVTDIQWWMDDQLMTNTAGEVRLQVTVQTNASGALITNNACATGSTICGRPMPSTAGSANMLTVAAPHRLCRAARSKTVCFASRRRFAMDCRAAGGVEIAIASLAPR